MRRLALIAALLLAGTATVTASAVGDDSHTYFIEMDNAFGLVEGSEVQVAGVTQGTIEELFLNSRKKAVAKAKLSGELGELGTETTCSSEPQSLIAEYFLDCQSAGPPIDAGGDTDGSSEERKENPDIGADSVFQTVQNDLVQNQLRMPFKDRLRLIFNEFGTALAGNPTELNEAIRRGAPALRQLLEVTDILGDQNQIITRLNVDSDRVLAELENRKTDVVRFVRNATRTAEASAERREALSDNFNLLDDFFAELRPTLRATRLLAGQQTPLLVNLRGAAPGLNTLAANLPDFNDASTDSLESLGEAGKVGRRVLDNGADELRLLARAVKQAPQTGELLADLLRDLDDPRRAIEVDQRAADRTGRSAPTGYTGLEGLLNYVYYQSGALNQFDEYSHLLHFSLFEFEAGPCGTFNATDEDGDGEIGVPNSDDTGVTTDILEANRCVAWLGDQQAGLSDPLGLPKYHPSVCQKGGGSNDLSLCNPSDPASAPARSRAGSASSAQGTNDGERGANRRGAAGPDLPGELDDLLDLPKADGDAATEAPKVDKPPTKRATRDLLRFLLEN